MEKEITPARMARENGWQVGMTLRSREEKRDDRFYIITAVGHAKVLGRRLFGDDVLGEEVELPLRDEFIEWSRNG